MFYVIFEWFTSISKITAIKCHRAISVPKMDHSNHQKWSVRCFLSKYIKHPEIISQNPFIISFFFYLIRSKQRELIHFFSLFFSILFSWNQFTRRPILPSVLILHIQRRNTRNPLPRNAGPNANLHSMNVRPRLLHAKKLSSPSSRLKSKHKRTLFEFDLHLAKKTHTFIQVFFILS